MHREHVGLRQQAVEVLRRAGELHTKFLTFLVTDVTDVDGEEAHAEAARALRQLHAAGAEAVEHQALPLQFLPDRLVKYATTQVGLRTRILPRQQQYHHHGVFGQRYRAELPGAVRDRDAARAPDVHLEVVQPRAQNLPQAHLTGAQVGHLLGAGGAADVDDHVHARELRRQLGLVVADLNVVSGGAHRIHHVHAPWVKHVFAHRVRQKQNLQFFRHKHILSLLFSCSSQLAACSLPPQSLAGVILRKHA